MMLSNEVLEIKHPDLYHTKRPRQTFLNLANIEKRVGIDVSHTYTHFSVISISIFGR